MAKLKPEQYLAIKWLSQPKKGGKTFEEIAEMCGVHPNTVYNWRNQDAAFDRELKRQIMRDTVDRLPEVMASVPDHIINDGNAALLKLMLQANDMLTEKHEVTADITDGKGLDAIRARIAAQKAEFTSTEE